MFNIPAVFLHDPLVPTAPPNLPFLTTFPTFPTFSPHPTPLMLVSNRVMLPIDPSSPLYLSLHVCVLYFLFSFRRLTFPCTRAPGRAHLPPRYDTCRSQTAAPPHSPHFRPCHATPADKTTKPTEQISKGRECRPTPLGRRGSQSDAFWLICCHSWTIPSVAHIRCFRRP